MKCIALFYGNCQAGSLQYALQHYPEFSGTFEYRFIPNWDDPGYKGPGLPEEDVGRCRLLFEQLGGPKALATQLRDRLLENTVAIRFPSLDTNMFWPFNTGDPRNVSEEGIRHGRYPYGDRIVVGLIKEGLSGEDLWRAYLKKSIETMPNLGRLKEVEEARLTARESAADVRISSYLLTVLYESYCFATLNHPKGWLLGRLWRDMIEQARLELGLSQPTHDITDRVFEKWDPLGEFELPIHPEIATHFRLRWWSPDHRYKTRLGMQTWEEYMRSYIDWV